MAGPKDPVICAKCPSDQMTCYVEGTKVLNGRQSTLQILADDGMLWLDDSPTVPAYAAELYVVSVDEEFL